MKRHVVMGSLAASLMLAACSGPAAQPDPGPGGGAGGGGGAPAPGNIVQVAASDPDFSILVAAVTKAGLAPALSDPGATLTVFAPTNAAFTALLGNLGITNGLDGLTAEQLKPILLYHVLGTEVDAAAATDAARAGTRVSSLGGKIQLALTGGSIRLDGKASVVAADIQASNGVVHVIDQVILPSIADIATTDARFSSLAAALVLADSATPSPGLVSALDDDMAANGFTVFAPTNDAFSALVTALKGADDGATTGITSLGSFRPEQVIPVLTYHVVGAKVLAASVPASAKVDTLGGKVAVTRAGSTVTVDGVDVAVADILASNGVIHAIGSVLLPSITDVVTTSASFSALKTAVLAADADMMTSPKVADALDGPGPFTLFAPSNQAFAALGTAPSGQALTNVLLYHAVPGTPVYATTALGLSAPLQVSTALTGKSLAVSAEGTPKGVSLADGTSTRGKVVEVDYFTANGVIHVTDKVLIPAP